MANEGTRHTRLLQTSFVTQQLLIYDHHPHFRLRRTETIHLRLTTMIFHDLTSLRNHFFSMERVRFSLFFYDLFHPKNLNPHVQQSEPSRQ